MCALIYSQTPLLLGAIKFFGDKNSAHFCQPVQTKTISKDQVLYFNNLSKKTLSIEYHIVLSLRIH